MFSNSKCILILLILLATFSVPSSAQDPIQQAAELIAQEKWEAAVPLLQSALTTDANNGRAILLLGEAQLGLKLYEEAIGSFTKSRSLGYRPLINSINIARVAAVQGKKEQVYAIFRTIARDGNGGRARPIIGETREFDFLRNDAEYKKLLEVELAPCKNTEYRQFDFWIGEWTVYDPAEKKILGTNIVTLEQDGCLLVENWKSAGGQQTGTSFNYYDIRDKKWHQLYLDNSGNAGAFPAMAGSLVGNRMVLFTEPSGKQRTRWTWTPLAPNKVRQAAEVSADDGVSWHSVWDSIYVRR
jgi:hypothetical protein